MGRLLDDSELEYFSGIASELNELAGDEVNYYAMNQPGYKIDPLYGEPAERSIDGPFRVPAWFQWPNDEPQATEQGFGREFDCMCVIARETLDNKNLPYPSEADIIEAWRTPYHDANSMGKGMFFDVIKVNNDGHVNDTASFVQFKLYLKRRTDFSAERRITPP